MPHTQILMLLLILYCGAGHAQFSFNNNNTGRRVVLVQAGLSSNPSKIVLQLLDGSLNPTAAISIYRRPLMSNNLQWQLKAQLPGGAIQWTDNESALGEVWEYQVKRQTINGEAIGYTCGSNYYDQTGYKGRMLLLVDSTLHTLIDTAIWQLRKDLTGDGWFVQIIPVNSSPGWNSGPAVTWVKQKIVSQYNAAPMNDKPKLLFLLGHVPLPRSGLNAVAPDDHEENKGARGADTYYADIEGRYTDTATYNPGNLATPLAINLPGDFKWDQDFIPGKLAMGFGRIDFTDLLQSYPTTTVAELTRGYLNRLHQYKMVMPGWYMGKRMAFNTGYDNSNDGSYRSLVPIAGKDSVVQYSGNMPFASWVQQNGPFMQFMQNQAVPEINDWKLYGMNAAVFSSDQSYYGFGDVPEEGPYSTIRSLLAADTKCLVSIWTTMSINIFHQPAVGIPFGLACRQIMNHNLSNVILEKPEQDYDNPQFWNRTHYQIYGDPSLRFFQVHPPGQLQVVPDSTTSVIHFTWQASPAADLTGYQLYKSATEWGPFQKVNNALIIGTTYTIPTDSAAGWFMLKAVKPETTGSGIFINSSQGVFTAIYHFTGSGNWSTSANWQGGIVPPAELPAGSNILINPSPTGQCVLDINQKALAGAMVQVSKGKRLVIPGLLTIR